MNATAINNITIEKIVACAATEAKQLVLEISKREEKPSLVDLENESIDFALRVGRFTLEALCQTETACHGPTVKGHVDVGKGTHSLLNKGPRRKMLKTLLGDISINRSYYRNSTFDDSRFPLDEEFGLLPEQTLSPKLEETMDYLSATMGSFDEGAKILKKLFRIDIEYKQFQRECQKLGKELEKEAIKETIQVFEEGKQLEYPRNKAPDMVVCSVDGITVEHCAGGAMEIKVGRAFKASIQRAPNKGSTRKKVKKRKRCTSRADDPKRAKEVSALKDSKEQREYSAATGLVKDAMKIVAPWRKDRDQFRPSSEKSAFVATSRLGTEQFGKELWLASQSVGAMVTPLLLFISDGSKWCWNICETQFADAIQILDVFHLARNIIGAANGIYGDRSKAAKAWRKEIMINLLRGQVKEIISMLERLRFLTTKKEKAKCKLITYLKNNSHRINYPKYIENKYPISSAMIEGACRHVIGSRMKGSGRRWDDDGADSMARLRALYCSGRWDCYHNERIRKRIDQAKSLLKTG